ncbi:transposase [Vineibacter terrae]|uniref:Transposase n=1 Tax=Vineibacter terrae TaxID=2586908 RepID=A0A5C8PIZ1_9HYPH|nr:transposase [Vineibacter terrae]TXL73657.1 transposase [Vineibacter terrae]
MSTVTHDQDNSRTDKGWYSRGYLPHFDGTGIVQTVVFRLHDSVPLHLRQQPTPREVERAFDAVLDSGFGACWLQDPQIADITERALLHFDGERCRLIAWCVTPNYVHAMLETLAGYSLPAVVHSWKSFTATVANRLLARTGPFWAREFFDRYVRDDRHFTAARNYIEDNPVKAGLATRPGDWRWSSARHRLRE